MKLRLQQITSTIYRPITADLANRTFHFRLFPVIAVYVFEVNVSISTQEEKLRVSPNKHRLTIS